MERFNKSLARDAVSAYVGVAEKHGLTATELAIAWVKSRPFVTSTIIGATSMEQLKVRTALESEEVMSKLLRAAGGI
jgi:aryl-alcohol dehydrogenase-like predicted oxidoreductase